MTAEWPEPGLCKDRDPDLWALLLPGEDHQQRLRRWSIAVTYCFDCPAFDSCEAEIDRRYDEGIKAGHVLPALRVYRSVGHEVGVVISRPSERRAA